MTEQQRQHLSALVDDELPTELLTATIAALQNDPELKSTWERYHLIGGILRSETVQPGYRAIATQVREQLRSEPTVIAPARASRGEASSRRGSFLGIGLAAAAAFLAVMAVPQLFDRGDGPATVVPPMAAVSPPPQFQIDGPAQRWHLDRPELARKLDRFLVNHQARSPASGLKGFIPYATVVGYEAGR